MGLLCPIGVGRVRSPSPSPLPIVRAKARGSLVNADDLRDVCLSIDVSLAVGPWGAMRIAGSGSRACLARGDGSASAAGALEAIAYASLGQEVVGVAGLTFEFPSQSPDE